MKTKLVILSALSVALLSTGAFASNARSIKDAGFPKSTGAAIKDYNGLNDSTPGSRDINGYKDVNGSRDWL